MQEIIELLEILSIPEILKIVFYPIIEIQKELEAIFIKKYLLRSIFRIVIIFIAGLLGVISSYYNQETFVFFLNICQLCKVPIKFQSLASIFLTILTSSYNGTYISEVIVKCLCKYLYGDYDFYITEERAIELATQFAEQEHCNITPDHVKKVIEFCRSKYRQASSGELGAKPGDWKKTIESILYYADLEHLLDQCCALEIKQTEIEEKIRIVNSLMTQSKSLPGTRTAVCSLPHNLKLPNESIQKLIIATPKAAIRKNSRSLQSAARSKKTDCSSTGLTVLNKGELDSKQNSGYSIYSGKLESKKSGPSCAMFSEKKQTSTENTPLLQGITSPSFRHSYATNSSMLKSIESIKRDLLKFKKTKLPNIAEHFYISEDEEIYLLQQYKHYLEERSLKTCSESLRKILSFRVFPPATIMSSSYNDIQNFNEESFGDLVFNEEGRDATDKQELHYLNRL